MKIPIGKTQFGSEIALDEERLIISRLLIQASSGGGKSYTLRKIAEGTQLQTLILDPEGEYVTLAERHDYLIVGNSEGASISAKPKTAALLAEKLMQLRVNCVMDLYDLKLEERRLFVKNFCHALLNLKKDLWHPVLCMLDEAHLYCPERSAGESCATEAVINLMSQGRKRGICGILATQRLSKLHKDAAAEVNNVLIGKCWLPNDQKRAVDILGDSKLQTQIRDLPTGEFYGFGPAFTLQGVTRLKVGNVKTTHQQQGHKLVIPAPSKVIQKHLAEFAGMEAEAVEREDALAKATRRVRELEQQLKAKPAPAKPEIVNREVQVSVFTPGEFQVFKDKTSEIHDALESLDKIKVVVKEIDAAVQGFQKKARSVKPTGNFPTDNPLRSGNLTEIKRQPLYDTMTFKKDGSPKNTFKCTPEGSPLSNPEQRILDAIAWLNSIGVEDPSQVAVAFLAGYVVGGGGFNNPKGSLRTKGLVEYLPGERIRLTEEGAKLASHPEEALTTEALHEKILSRLPNPEQRVLKPILAAYGNAISNEALAEAAGYALGSGGFNNPKGRLRSLGLIEYVSGGCRAKDYLFI